MSINIVRINKPRSEKRGLLFILKLPFPYRLETNHSRKIRLAEYASNTRRIQKNHCIPLHPTLGFGS